MIRLGRDKKTALVSIVVTAFFAVRKYFIGILSGSIAIFGDAVHSFTDVITSIGVLIGLIISSRKPTKTFPYGFH
ncbi:MAG TPA: cation transporter, partial [Desulfobacteraceae bacterium]|nr:cation transporter [Desulfobacteraceae bacterium]